MSTPAQGPISLPDLRALLGQLKTDIFTTFNCHQLGTIQSFNASKQTATVSVNLLRMVPDLNVTPTVYRNISYPLLVDVPVFINSGGSGYLTLPIAAGDTCLVLFNDRDIDTWFSTGSIAEPNSQRCHDLSDGLALVGFRSLANALQGFDTDNAVLAFEGGKIKVADKLDFVGQLSTMRAVMGTIYAALIDLNTKKTGASAITTINAFQTEYNNLLQ